MANIFKAYSHQYTIHKSSVRKSSGSFVLNEIRLYFVCVFSIDRPKSMIMTWHNFHQWISSYDRTMILTFAMRTFKHNEGPDYGSFLHKIFKWTSVEVNQPSFVLLHVQYCAKWMWSSRATVNQNQIAIMICIHFKLQPLPNRIDVKNSSNTKQNLWYYNAAVIATIILELNEQREKNTHTNRHTNTFSYEHGRRSSKV